MTDILQGDYPLCTARGLLTPTPAGMRVTLGKLYASFDGVEIPDWFKYAGTIEQDAFGMLPAGVEKFLESIA